MVSINETIDAYEAARKEIFKHVGYVEDWVVLPLDDQRRRAWRIVGGDECGAGGKVMYADTDADLDDPESKKLYSATVYTQRFLPRWVYRGAEVTLVVVDTHCDGNRFLMLFDNSKERPGDGTQDEGDEKQEHAADVD